MTSLAPDGFLILSFALFALAIFGILSRRNFILLLVSLEIGINAAILNFIFFAALNGSISGQAIAVVLVGFAATEVAVGLAIVLALNRLKGSINVAEATTLRS